MIGSTGVQSPRKPSRIRHIMGLSPSKKIVETHHLAGSFFSNDAGFKKCDIHYNTL